MTGTPLGRRMDQHSGRLLLSSVPVHSTLSCRSPRRPSGDSSMSARTLAPVTICHRDDRLCRWPWSRAGGREGRVDGLNRRGLNRRGLNLRGLMTGTGSHQSISSGTLIDGGGNIRSSSSNSAVLKLISTHAVPRQPRRNWSRREGGPRPASGARSQATAGSHRPLGSPGRRTVGLLQRHQLQQVLPPADGDESYRLPGAGPG